MLVRKLEDVETQDVTAYGSTKTKIQWLISKEQGAPRFAMRLFTLEPGAVIGTHAHPEEHEIFVLKGEMDLIGENGEKTHVKATNAIYVPPFEKHGYRNDGNEQVQFICVIPLLEK
ncbi:MAG: cupin domain-containing protein [Candidatus Heimdallarchaeota archaeon]